MDFTPVPIKVYIKTDKNSYIISVNSSIFISDKTDWIYIDEGFGDKYAHAQSAYFSKQLTDEKGLFNYKYSMNLVSETTEPDKQQQLANRPLPPPSEIQYAQQSITDLEIENIEQGQALTDLELLILSKGA